MYICFPLDVFLVVSVFVLHVYHHVWMHICMSTVYRVHYICTCTVQYIVYMLYTFCVTVSQNKKSPIVDDVAIG